MKEEQKSGIIVDTADEPQAQEPERWLELREQRSRHGKVYALGGNRYRAVVYAGAVHRYNETSGIWEETEGTEPHTPEDPTTRERTAETAGEAWEGTLARLERQGTEETATRAETPESGVRGGEVTSTAIEDTYVRSNAAGTNYGSAAELWIADNPTYGTRHAYIRVNELPALDASAHITAA